MAWHVFEKLLEGVANYSTFVGKIWITFLFIFRIIMVASIGDTVYNDEQSQFICNTLQPGCQNVCFNKFSPISQIRFWAVQILFVGTPSVVFIIYAMHKMSDPSLQDKKDDARASRRDRRSEGSIDHDEKSRRRNDKDTSEKSVDSKPSLPRYADAVAIESLDKRSVNGFARVKQSNKSSSHASRETMNDRKQGLAEIIYIPPEPVKERKKPEVKRKTVFHKDGQSEVVKTPSIARAYLAQTLVRTIVEVIFLYLQYYMYSFHVNELYVCERDPCPKQVDCYVSRPKEKTLFLHFMYAMTFLSIALNAVEILQMTWHFCRGKIGENKELKRLYIADRPDFGDYRLRGHRRRRGRRQAYPTIGPYPRRHGNSFTDTEDNNSIQSDYSFYEE